VTFPVVSIKANCLDNDAKMVLFQVADKLRACPEKKIIINGPSGKSSKYNATGNTRCVDDLINFLTEKYGISRDRIIINYSGGTSNGIELKTN
jgi:hypothetical protein